MLYSQYNNTLLFINLSTQDLALLESQQQYTRRKVHIIVQYENPNNINVSSLLNHVAIYSNYCMREKDSMIFLYVKPRMYKFIKQSYMLYSMNIYRIKLVCIPDQNKKEFLKVRHGDYISVFRTVSIFENDVNNGIMNPNSSICRQGFEYDKYYCNNLSLSGLQHKGVYYWL